VKPEGDGAICSGGGTFRVSISHRAVRAPLALFFVVVCVACGGKTPEPVAGPLKVGVATLELDYPLGIAMGGYSREIYPDEPGSPYAKGMPSSRGIHTRPTARALAFDNGVTKVVIVRGDIALMTPSLQSRIEQHVARDGVHVVALGTHTHQGPARFFAPAYAAGEDHFDVPSISMDFYDAELEDTLAASIAKAATTALDAMVPAAVGHASVDASVLNGDRRCENDILYGMDYRNRMMDVMRFDAVMPDGTIGATIAGMMRFAAHGTVLSSDNTLVTSDAPGAIERAATAALGAPVLFLQGDAGDVSPDHGFFNGLQGIERMFITAGPLAKQAFDMAAPHDVPKQATLEYTLRGISTKYPDMGYEPKEFPPYGAVECGLGVEDCNLTYTKQNMVCLALAPTGLLSAPVSALKLADMLFVFLPGEPLTAIGDRIREQGGPNTMVVGYSMAHHGYILEEPDYMRGGYEPTVSPWGWRFGDYLVHNVRSMLVTLGTPQPKYTPPDVPALDETLRRVPTPASVMAGPATQPKDIERLMMATFTFHGVDPLLGAPHVSLEVMKDGMFTATGIQDGPDIVLRYASDPTFKADPMAATRDHLYTAEWETLQDTATGTYRFVSGGVVSDPFKVTPSTAVASGTAVISGGMLQAQLRFPPNDTITRNGTDPIGNYRIRDITSQPWLGALVQGGHAVAHVTAPDSSVSDVMLTGTGTQFAGALASGTSGHYSVAIDANAAVDGQGNTNAMPLHFDVNL
jgi:hypothetical protein